MAATATDPRTIPGKPTPEGDDLGSNGKASSAAAHLWYLSDAGHTQGLRSHPEAYAAHVTAFPAPSAGAAAMSATTQLRRAPHRRASHAGLPHPLLG
jgi:hypothetical protein